MALNRPAKVARGAFATAFAVFAGGVAWVLFQQGEGSVVYLACGAGGPPLGLGLGLAALALCTFGGGVAWGVAHMPGTPTRGFLGRIGLGAAAIFGFAILVMIAAIWLVPSCAR
jgi:hypothetical protein